MLDAIPTIPASHAVRLARKRFGSTRRAPALLALAAGALLMFGLSATAMAQKGSLYVHAHIDPQTATKTDGAQYATVFVYDDKGAKIPSGKGAGGWLPGAAIPLPAGDYWVALGSEEHAHNLHAYAVEAGKTTLVESGWVSVATLPLAKQPLTDCNQWTATLRAYIEVDGKLELVMTNSNRRPDAFGTIQLHPGEYVLEFNRTTTKVTVEAGKDLRLATGYAGPTASREAQLLRSRGDDPLRDGIAVCTDGGLHVLAGSYFIRELVMMDDGAAIDHRVTPFEVEKEGNFGATTLKNDAPSDARKGAGTLISAAQAKALSAWGSKRGTYDDLQMFGP